VLSKVCIVCRWSWGWDPDHKWKILGTGPYNEEVVLCGICSETPRDPKNLLFGIDGSGCCMHIVVEDGNVKDEDVHWCINYAKEKGHTFCEAVGKYLLTLPPEDRQF
jgi:hypothetical protein